MANIRHMLFIPGIDRRDSSNIYVTKVDNKQIREMIVHINVVTSSGHMSARSVSIFLVSTEWRFTKSYTQTLALPSVVIKNSP